MSSSANLIPNSATIRSGWIIEEGSDIPRLTTCYPL
ncbi:DUF6883 domain-containing protein [Nostoc commune]